MFERNAISVERSLFAGKGNAKPTADYVPQLSTDSPAEIDEMPDGNGPATLPEAKPITGAVGLGGLIQRRVEVGQEDAGLVQTEAYPEYEKHEEEARAGREAAQRVQRESAELTAKATQHFDRGVLYETLRLGLPTPSADAVETKPTIPELNHAEPSESPAAPTEEHARPDISAAPTLAPKRPKRRKMTMRLEPEEWVAPQGLCRRDRSHLPGHPVDRDKFVHGRGDRRERATDRHRPPPGGLAGTGKPDREVTV